MECVEVYELCSENGRGEVNDGGRSGMVLTK